MCIHFIVVDMAHIMLKMSLKNENIGIAAVLKAFGCTF